MSEKVVKPRATKNAKSVKVVVEKLVVEKAPKTKKAPKKVNEPESVQEQVEAAEVQAPVRDKRTFRVVYRNPQGEAVLCGRYCGAKPKQAASKAFTGICKTFKKAEQELDGPVHFFVVECTRGSKCKKYFYTGERTKLDTPAKIEIADGKMITYNFNNTVKKSTQEECLDLLDYKVVENEQPEVEAEQVEAVEEPAPKQRGGRKKKTESVEVVEVAEAEVVEPVAEAVAEPVAEPTKKKTRKVKA